MTNLYIDRVFESIKMESPAQVTSMYLSGCSPKFVGFYKLDGTSFCLFRSTNKNIYRIEINDIISIRKKLSYEEIKIKEVDVTDKESVTVLLEIYKSLNQNIEFSSEDIFNGYSS